MAEDTYTFKLNARQAELSGKAVESALDGINASMDDLENVTLKLNEKTGKLGLTYDGVTKSGVKFRGFLEDVNRFFPKVTQQAEKQIKALSALEKKYKDISTLRAAQTTQLAGLRQSIEAEVGGAREQFIEQFRERIQERFTARAAEDNLRRQTASVASGFHLRDINEAIKSSDTATKDLAKSTVKANEAAQDVLLTWRSVARLFAVQLLHQSIALLRVRMEEAQRTALDLEKAIAEIRTISGEASNTTTDWANALRDLSGQIPFDQVELAEAAYQALSNQVIQTSQDLTFIRSASELAIVGVSNLDTSVGALTAVLNAFDLSALRTASVSADLFKTIELGRTRLDTLQENLGRASVLSAQLGVSFREQQSALAALTIQGLKDNVAKTLLVNIYNKLIRPSERLKEIFKDWGVTSGEAAIQAFGLTGVMQRLFDISEKTGDSTSELGEIFQRIRATIGSLALDTEATRKTFDRFGTDTLTEFNEKLKEIQESTFVRYKQALTDLNNAFLGFGQTLNRVLINLADAFGGADKAVQTLTTSLTLLIGAVAGNRLAAGMLRLQAAIAAASFSINPLVAALTAIGPIIAFIILDAARWESKVVESIKRVQDEYGEYLDLLTKKHETAIKQWLDAVDDSTSKATRSFAIVNTEIQKMLNLLDNDLKKSFKDLDTFIDDFSQTSTDRLRSNLENLRNTARDTRHEIEEARRELEQTLKRQERLEEEIGERRLDAKLRDLNPREQFDLLEAVNTETSLKKALEVLKKVGQDRLLTQEQVLELKQLEERIEDKITRLKEKQLAAEKEKARALRDQQRQAEELFQRQQRAIARRETSLREFDFAVDLFQRLGPDSGKGEVQRFGNDLIEAAEAAGIATLKIKEEIERRVTQIEQNELTKRQREQDKALRVESKRIFEELKARQKAAEDAINESQNTATNSVQAINAFIGRFEKFTPTGDQLFLGGPGEGQQLSGRTQAQQRVLDRLEKLRITQIQVDSERKRAQPNEAFLNQLLRQRAELLEKIVELTGKTGFVDAVFDNGLTGQDAIKQLLDADKAGRSAIESLIVATKELQEVQAASVAINKKLQDAGLDREALDATKSNTESINDLRVAMFKNIDATRELRDALVVRLKNVLGAIGGPAAAFAAGGLFRGAGGIDNNVVRVSDGEFIMNSSSTRQFLPILHAMNNTRGFANGGRVQNINIGDITVTGGNTSQATARQIARDIKREIQRGTLTL